jgi:hypothetical protein
VLRDPMTDYFGRHMAQNVKAFSEVLSLGNNEFLAVNTAT